jgi:hypothetical protein
VNHHAGEQIVLRHDPSRTTLTPDWELGVAAVILLIAVVLAAFIVPVFA